MPVKEEQVKKAYAEQVYNRSREIAMDKDRLIAPQAQHLCYALLEQLAEAYVSNIQLVAAVNDLKSDLESLRRAVANEEKKPAFRSVN